MSGQPKTRDRAVDQFSQFICCFTKLVSFVQILPQQESINIRFIEIWDIIGLWSSLMWKHFEKKKTSNDNWYNVIFPHRNTEKCTLTMNYIKGCKDQVQECDLKRKTGGTKTHVVCNEELRKSCCNKRKVNSMKEIIAGCLTFDVSQQYWWSRVIAVTWTGQGYFELTWPWI